MSQQLHEYQSSQDMLADAVSDRFNAEVKPRLAPPTERGQGYLLRTWTEYKSIIERMEPTLYVEPILPWLRRLFRSLAQRPGRLGERLAIQSLVQYVTAYQGIFKREYDIVLDPKDVAILKDYINDDLRREFNLSNKERPKVIVRSEDFKEIVLFMWTEDTHKYREQRSQLQEHWLNLVLFYSISRPGCLVTPNDYKGSDQYLQYQDCELWLKQNPHGGPPNLYLDIAFRFRKNERNDDNSVHLTLWENIETPSLCPVKPFLAMAFMDGAFGKHDPARLFRPLKRDKVQVKVEQSIRHIPVLRKSNSSEGLSYAAWAIALQRIGFRMGYRVSPTSYSYRYYGANVLIKKIARTQTKMVMGHSDDRPINKHYQSKTMPDLQSIVMGQEPKEDIATITSCVSATRFRKAPYKLPPELHETVINIEEVRKLTHIRDTTETGARSKITTKLNILKARLRREALDKLRENYFARQEVSIWDDESEDEELKSELKSEEEQPTTLHPTRKAIVDLFYHTQPSTAVSLLLIREYMNLIDLKWMGGKPSPPSQLGLKPVRANGPKVTPTTPPLTHKVEAGENEPDQGTKPSQFPKESAKSICPRDTTPIIQFTPGKLPPAHNIEPEANQLDQGTDLQPELATKQLIALLRAENKELQTKVEDWERRYEEFSHFPKGSDLEGQSPPASEVNCTEISHMSNDTSTQDLVEAIPAPTATPPTAKPSKAVKKRRNGPLRVQQKGPFKVTKERYQQTMIHSSQKSRNETIFKTWWCPYRSCVHHQVYLPSLDHLREHFSVEHRILSKRKDPCKSKKCPTHRGTARTSEIIIMHDDIQKIMGQRIEYERCRAMLQNWQPAEVESTIASSHH